MDSNSDAQSISEETPNHELENVLSGQNPNIFRTEDFKYIASGDPEIKSDANSTVTAIQSILKMITSLAVLFGAGEAVSDADTTSKDAGVSSTDDCKEAESSAADAARSSASSPVDFNASCETLCSAAGGSISDVSEETLRRIKEVWPDDVPLLPKEPAPPSFCARLRAQRFAWMEHMRMFRIEMISSGALLAFATLCLAFSVFAPQYLLIISTVSYGLSFAFFWLFVTEFPPYLATKDGDPIYSKSVQNFNQRVSKQCA